MKREVPKSKETTIWYAAGKWFHRRSDAYYAIAKAIVLERYPRWLEGDDHAFCDVSEFWNARRIRRIELFHTFVPQSYDEPEHDYFDSNKWRAFVKRLARFMMFVDDRIAELMKPPTHNQPEQRA